nr:ABZJ_00895 family protein [Kordiimonas marina]
MEETAEAVPVQSGVTSQGAGPSVELLPDAQPVGKYVKYYLLINVAVVVLLGIVVALTGFDPGSSIGVAVIICAAMATHHKFIMDNGRALLPVERRKLAWWANVFNILLTIAVALPIVGLAALAGQLDTLGIKEADLSVVFVAFLIIVGGAIQYFGIWFSLGRSSKFSLKAYEEKRAKQAAQEG